MENTFEKIIGEVQIERLKEQALNQDILVNRARREYALFCCWCNAFRHGKEKDNAETFGQYIKAENVKLDFWTKKKIAEAYFGYSYEFDLEKGKWKIKKEVRNEI